MFGRNKSHVFATQEAHKLNSCNHNKYKNPPIREDRRVFLCRQAVFSCRKAVHPCLSEVGLYAE